jgi:DNA (cytosine-5)-methyltransferase 1
MTKHKFAYKWRLADGYPAKEIDYHGLKVFGTFICGGGSTMGYKLAGFEHLGGVEIDPQVASIYKANHSPKYLYVQDIREFVKRDDLPDELFSLDLLDGSPPCSSFSMAGNREKDWGKEKVFREGQAHQRLDDLFFDYIALAKKLQPKVVIAENVKGLISGNAKAYVHKIKKGFEDAGYKVQLFLLNAASMGVPQKRERVFFICQRNDMNFPKLDLQFSEDAIPFGKIKETGLPIGINGQRSMMWEKCEQGKSFATVSNGNNFSSIRLSDTQVCNTITANQCEGFFHSTEKRKISDNEVKLIGTFPFDYSFQNMRPMYLIGMSVPPVMTAQIAHQIYLQWFK